MSAPAIVIRLELEEPLRVFAAWLCEGDELRMRLWLRDHPEHADLVARAMELAEEEPAA